MSDNVMIARVEADQAPRVKTGGREAVVIRHPGIGKFPGGSIVLEDMYTKPIPRLV